MKKNKIIIGLLLVLVLITAFIYGGASGAHHFGIIDNDKEIVSGEKIANADNESAVEEKSDASALIAVEDKQDSPEEMTGTKAEPSTPLESADKPADTPNTAADTSKDKYQTDPVPAGHPAPVEPEEASISNKELKCTLSVRCDTILDNMDRFDPEKVELVPADGVIYAEKTVTFYEGESVFNLLVREMKQSKIHLEFENTPIYNSAYIEGIANLYEFDCGELSGWMYRVNGWFPNYGCSRYELQDGDKVEWLYTCDLGADIGGGDSTRNGR